MECPRCGNEMEDDRCYWCAYDNRSSGKKSDLEKIKKGVRDFVNSLTLASFTLFLILCIILVSGYTGDLITGSLDSSTVIFVVLLFAVPVVEVGGVYFAAYTLFIVCGVLVSFGYLLYRELNIQYDEHKRKGNLSVKITGTPMFRLASTFFALMFIYYVYLLMLEVAGVSVTSPFVNDIPLWEYIYSITRASVWEEITIRVVFLGIPVAVYGFVNDKKDWLKSLLGGFGLEDRFVLWPILISSIIFAVAHLPGWDFYKLPPTFIAGLIFGYLFAKDGLHSCIIFHFVWNFSSVFFRLPFWLSFLATVFILGAMLLGSYYTLSYGKKTFKWMIRPVSGVRKSDKEENRLTAGVNAGFICPNCRNDTAIYTEQGMLKCRRCASEVDPSSRDAMKQLKAYEKMREWPPSN